MIATLGIIFLIIIALLAVSAVFSAAETALTSASRGRMHQLEREGDKSAARVNRLFAQRETMIGAVLLGYKPDQHPDLGPGHRVHHQVGAGRLGRGAGHRPDDRAGAGLRRSAAKDPGDPAARRHGAQPVGIHPHHREAVRPGDLGDPVDRTDDAAPVRGAAVDGDRRAGRTRRDPWRGGIPPLRRPGGDRGSLTCWAGCSTSPPWTCPT